MRLKPIMFVGTCSDAGKSILNTAFCRIFRQDGYTPAPFKAQNMSLNSYSTPEGGEMGRAQVVQAEACGVVPHTDMNPVLLKPSSDQTSQVILNGKPIGNRSAREYFSSGNMRPLFDEALKAFRRLEQTYNPIVLEGAGSISELNLHDRDIVNMPMACEVGAATYLVADIDRGGVFASVYGSVMLLPEEERKFLKGIIINKFRGDISLFEDGRCMIGDLTGIPVVGVIPYFKDMCIEQEDSVMLDKKTSCAEAGKINVAVILLRHMSNFTDFNALEQDPRFHLYYTNDVMEISRADLVILPGSKNTIADLQAIHLNGVAKAIVRSYREGRKVIGICGGYQMMGVCVEDPDCIEGTTPAIPGLGLLPLISVIGETKIVCQSRFRFKNHDTLCDGYQIHMGQTFPVSEAGRFAGVMMDGVETITPAVLNILIDGTSDGCQINDRCWGTYMHGIFDNPLVLNDLASGLIDSVVADFDYKAFKEQQYDLLASRVRKAVDMEYIYSTLGIES